MALWHSHCAHTALTRHSKMKRRKSDGTHTALTLYSHCANTALRPRSPGKLSYIGDVSEKSPDKKRRESDGHYGTCYGGNRQRKVERLRANWNEKQKRKEKKKQVLMPNHVRKVISQRTGGENRWEGNEAPIMPEQKATIESKNNVHVFPCLSISRPSEMYDHDM